MTTAIFELIGGLVLTTAYFVILQEKRAFKIRNSKYWFPIWFGSLLIVCCGLSLIFSALSDFGVKF